MAKLYREHVLGEKPVEGLVSLDSIRPASNNAASPINRHTGNRARSRRLGLRIQRIAPSRIRNLGSLTTKAVPIRDGLSASPR